MGSRLIDDDGPWGKAIGHALAEDEAQRAGSRGERPEGGGAASTSDCLCARRWPSKVRLLQVRLRRVNVECDDTRARRDRRYCTVRYGSEYFPTAYDRPQAQSLISHSHSHFLTYCTY